MAEVVQNGLVSAVKIARETAVQQTPNGVRYATYGENDLATADLERIVQAVPATIAAALGAKIYYFIPLAMSSPSDREQRSDEETMIAPVYTAELSDRAICHRNVKLEPGESSHPSGPQTAQEGVFISTRLLNDRFALAFEFFINVGHAFVEVAGVPEGFHQLVWEQALKGVRGETSQDAWESRNQALADPKAPTQIDEKARTEFVEASFSDTVAIYLLSLSIDFNYSELREREYPLLAPQALAERLRLAAKLFPPNPGYEFAIRYRRRA